MAVRSQEPYDNRDIQYNLAPFEVDTRDASLAMRQQSAAMQADAFQREAEVPSKGESFFKALEAGFNKWHEGSLLAGELNRESNEAFNEAKQKELELAAKFYLAREQWKASARRPGGKKVKFPGEEVRDDFKKSVMDKNPEKFKAPRVRSLSGSDPGLLEQGVPSGTVIEDPLYRAFIERWITPAMREKNPAKFRRAIDEIIGQNPNADELINGIPRRSKGGVALPGKPEFEGYSILKPYLTWDTRSTGVGVITQEGKGTTTGDRNRPTGDQPFTKNWRVRWNDSPETRSLKAAADRQDEEASLNQGGGVSLSYSQAKSDFETFKEKHGDLFLGSDDFPLYETRAGAFLRGRWGKKDKKNVKGTKKGLTPFEEDDTVLAKGEIVLRGVDSDGEALEPFEEGGEDVVLRGVQDEKELKITSLSAGTDEFAVVLEFPDGEERAFRGTPEDLGTSKFPVSLFQHMEQYYGAQMDELFDGHYVPGDWKKTKKAWQRAKKAEKKGKRGKEPSDGREGLNREQGGSP